MEKAISTQKDPNSPIKSQVLGESVSKTTQEPIPVLDEGDSLFPPPVVATLCSWNLCSAGHRSRPTAAMVECPGCGSPTIVVKLENCPICNEPLVQSSFRSDMVPRGGGLAKRCKGENPRGESVDIVLERGHWEEVEKTPKV